jgi:hypothetical protein
MHRVTVIRSWTNSPILPGAALVWSWAVGFQKMPSSDRPQSPEYLLSKYVTLQSELAKTYLELKELRKQVDELERLVRERAQVRNTKARPGKRRPHKRLVLRVRRIRK